MNRLLLSNFCRRCSLLVRQNFSKECEEALNNQINIELKAFYEYLSMAYHFDRCDASSPGASKFFKSASDEERHHAELIMAYMNKRGGEIKLKEIVKPKMTYESIKEAISDAVQLEKDVNEALLNAHSIANNNQDPNMCSFLEDNFLQEQVDGIKQLANYLTQIYQAECETGLFLFDKVLMHEADSLHQKKGDDTF